MTRHYFLRPSRVRDIVDEHHITHATVARRLGVSRAYWSQLINGKRALSPSIRRLILDCEIFAGVAESELWERIVIPDCEAS